MRKVLYSVVLSIAVIIGMFPLSFNVGAVDVVVNESQSSEISYSAIESYREYFSGVSNKQNADEAVKGISLTDEAEQQDGSVVLKETQTVAYEFVVENEGLYNIVFNYAPLKSKGQNIEFALKLDGKIPFEEASYCTFYRTWCDDAETIAKTDSQGNDITPNQIELFNRQTVCLQDNTGTYNEPYLFYFSSGKHTVELIGQREQMTVYSLNLQPQKKIISYKEYSEKNKQSGYACANSELEVFEAENAYLKSDSVLYGRNDRSSPLSTPYSASAIKLNTIGGTSWSTQGQWIEWEINVKESGLYRFTFRARQNFISGSFVSRKMYIDGVMPFAECADIRIPYSTNWQNITPEYDFYLEKGKHTIKLEVTIGALSDIVSKIDKAVFELNSAYRKVIMITGTEPDKYRDYELDKYLPEVFEIFKNQSESLKSVNEELIRLSKKRGSMNGILQTLENQLIEFIEKPEKIQNQLSSFKDNVASLGTWLTDIRTQSLELDKFYLYPSNIDENEIPKATAGFFEKLKHEARIFISSFVVDYNVLSDNSQGANMKKISVWVQAGRDQANIIKEMVNNDFSVKNDIRVELKLVQGQLMAATASGVGPDAVLQSVNSEPINYAVRNAVVDLTQFPDFKEISSRFRDSALTPYTFNGSVYALPETQTFSILFYRKDILAELGIEIPETWEEMFAAIGILQKNNMTAGIQPPNSAAGSFTALSTMAMLLYQEGGELYNDNNSKSGLSTEAAQSAFEKWVSLYIDYDLPTKYDALNRFRSGEMPMLIDDFTLYNLISVGAPELRGMWGFAGVPGTLQDDGTLNYNVPSTGICCMIMNNTKALQEAWEFIKWWISAEIQSEYGREMENKLGVSARYPSANIEAFSNMSWSVSELAVLNSQWQNVKGIPEIPGGYFTTRHLNNAFRRVLSYNEDPRETLLNYAEKIDDEITAKRKEFNIH